MTKIKDLKDLKDLSEGDAIDPDKVIEQQEDPTADVDIKKINDILLSNEIQKGGKIRLERRGPTEQDFAYLCKMPSEQFDIERIKVIYGGGDYKAQTYRSNGQMYRPFTFSIDPRFKGTLDEQQIKAISGTTGAKDEGITTKLLDMVMSGAGNRGQLSHDPTLPMLKMFEAMGERSDKMMVMMGMMQAENQKSQMGMMTAMMTILSNNKSTGPDPVFMEMVKSAMAPRATTPMMEMLEMMKAIKELSAGETPKEETTLDKILGALPAVAGTLLGARGGGFAQMQQPTAPAPIPEAPKLEVLPTPPPLPDQQNMLKANEFINKVFMAAQFNMDPMSVYDMICLTLNPTQIGELKKVLTEPNWAATLFNNDERVEKFKDWLEDLRQIIIHDGTLPESDPAPPTTGGN